MTRRRIKMAIAGFLLIFAVLFVSSVLLITSNFGLTRIVAPLLGQLIDARFYVEKASFSIWDSKLVVHGVSVGYENAPMVTGDGECKFNIAALFKNHLNFVNIHITSANLLFYQGEDNKWNIPWLYTPDSSSTSEDIQLDFKNIRIDKLNIIYDKKRYAVKDRFRITARLEDVTSGEFGNNKPSRLSFHGDINLSSGQNINVNKDGTKGVFEVNLTSDYSVKALMLDLMSDNIYGSVAGKQFSDTGLRFILDTDTDDKGVLNINRLEARCYQNHTQSSLISLNGRYRESPLLMDFRINAPELKSRLLNFIAMLFGDYNLGDTSGKFRGRLYQTGDNFEYSGEIEANDISFKSPRYMIMPRNPLQMNVIYDIKEDLRARTLSINNLDAVAFEDNKQTARLSLNNPFTIQMNEKADIVLDSSPEIGLEIHDADAAFLNNLIPSYIKFTSGTFNSDIKAVLHDNANNLNVSGTLNSTGTALKTDVFSTGSFDYETKFNFDIRKLSSFFLNDCSASVKHSGTTVAEASIAGHYDNDLKTGSVHIKSSLIDSRVSAMIIAPQGKSPDIIFDTLSGLYGSYTVSSTASFSFNSDKYGACDVVAENASSLIANMQNTMTTASLKAPQHMHIDDKGCKLVTSPEFEIIFRNMNASGINNFLPASLGLSFVSGKIDSDCNLTSDANFGNIQMSGDVTAENMSFKLNDEAYQGIGLKSAFQSGFDPGNDFTIDMPDFKLYSGDSLMLDSSAEIALSLSGKAANRYSFNVNEMNERFLYIADPSLRDVLKKAEINGNFEMEYNPGASSISINTSIPSVKLSILNSAHRELPISGYANANVIARKGVIDAESIELNITESGEKIFHVNASGDIASENHKKVATLNIASEGIDLEKTIDTISFFLPENDDTDTSAAIRTLPLDGLTVKSAIDLKNIRYGNKLKGDVTSRLTIENNTILVYPCMITINNSPSDMYFFIDTANESFLAKALLKSDMNLNPIIKTFVPGNYKTAEGHIRKLNLYMQGKGFSNRDLDRNLTGELYSEVYDLSLPANIQHYRLLRAMLIPMQFVSKIQQFVPGGLLPGNIIQAALSTQNIFSYNNNIFLRSGEINISKQPGMINLKKIVFSGNSNDFVQMASFTGTIDGNGNMNLHTNSVISGITIPLDIYGNLDNPSPDTGKFVADFFKTNTLELFSPSSVNGMIKATASGVESTVKGTVGFVGGLISNPVQEISSFGSIFTQNKQDSGNQSPDNQN